MEILKVLNRNGTEKVFKSIEELSSHDKIFFKCERCGSEGSTTKQKFTEPICKKCKLSLLDRSNYKKVERDYSKIASCRTEESFNKAKETRKKTLRDKYNVSNVMELDEVREKVKQTNLEIYGVESPLKLEITREKNKEVKFNQVIERLKSFDIVPLFTFIDYYDSRNINNIYKWKCLKCNSEFECNYYDSKLIPRCPECNPVVSGTSKGETEMSDFIKEQIFKILKTNGKEYTGKIESAGSHYYVEFECEKCGNQSRKQIRRFNGDFSSFICGDCLLTGRTHSEETKRKIGESSKKNNCISFAQKSLQENKEEISLKRINTNIERFGGKSPMSSEEVREKVSNSNLLKSIEKIKESGFEPLFDSYCGKESGEVYKWKCLTCGEIFDDKFNDKKTLPRCPKCNPYVKTVSASEEEMKQFIETSVRYRDKWEIDCYVEALKIGFEFNGLYWHSDVFKDKNYHLEKTKYFKEKGIKLYHIFEDEWEYKKDIVKSIINTKLGISSRRIFARKCEIREVSSKESKQFQDENHLQGKSSSSVNLGLYIENELISLMTFGKCRFGKYEWELVRYVNKKDTVIVGSASRLFKKFIKEYNPKTIVSYSDTRIFDGGMYETLGFSFSHSTPPQYYYVKNGRRFNRMNFQKKFLKDKLSEYNEELSEEKNMKNNGFSKIYDCGVKVWIYNVKINKGETK